MSESPKHLIVEGLGKRYLIGANRPKHLTGAERFAALRGLLRRPAAARGGYREIWALRHVSFSLDRGTTLAIIGPNGAGKTTLLNIVGRISPPTEGRVEGTGRVVSLVGIGAGMDPYLTGRENVFLEAALHGFSRAEAARRVDRIARLADLGDLFDVPVRRYSAGMFTRLAFSVAMSLDPDILLADEILAVGDIAFQERCLEEVGGLGRRGTTVLFVTHDMSAVRRICRRALWLNAGRVAAFGDVEEVVAAYESAALAPASAEDLNGEAPERGRILSVTLVSVTGEPIAGARTSDRVGIEVRFDMPLPGATVRCAVSLFARGAHVLCSVQQDEVVCNPPGIFRATAWLPEGLLAETVYTVKAAVLVSAGGAEWSIIRDHALAIRVFAGDAPGAARLPTAALRRLEQGGVVAPRLRWDTRRGGDP